MNWNRFVLTALSVLMIPLIAHAKPEKRLAVVIGNSLYTDAPLIRPTSDVNSITKALGKCNFTVTKELNLDKKNMERVLSEFQQALTETGGIGFFFFAGNGFQADGENYLIPIDADPDNKAEAVSGSIRLSSIFEIMKASGNRLNIVVVEAANASPFGTDFQPAEAGFADLVPPEGVLFMSAAQPDTVVEETADRKSLFTSRLSELLAAPEIDLKDGFEELREDILKSTDEKQDPWLSSGIEQPAILNYPKRDFFNLLSDVRQFMQFSETQKDMVVSAENAREPSSATEIAWQALLEFYPRWASKLDSDDPVDLIVIALNEDLEGDFFNMTQLFHFSLKKTNSIDMEFVYIPPGKFMMGSPFDEPSRGEDENQRQVTIGNGFFMQTTEVTQAQWMALMERNPANFDECGPDCPVESVSWSDVQTFIERLNELEETENYRLPTEAEWEYAARSGENGWFSFGSDPNRFPEYAWYKGNSEGGPHPVAQKKPNQWGLYDVHGNVWEWCGDREGEYQLVRGGSWFYPMMFARSANRFFVFPKDRNYTIGFRLIKTP